MRTGADPQPVSAACGRRNAGFKSEWDPAPLPCPTSGASEGRRGDFLAGLRRGLSCGRRLHLPGRQGGCCPSAGCTADAGAVQLLRPSLPVRCSAGGAAGGLGHRSVCSSVGDRASGSSILATPLHRLLPAIREAGHAHGSGAKCHPIHDFNLRLGDHRRGCSRLSTQMAVPAAATGHRDSSDRSVGTDQRHFRP